MTDSDMDISSESDNDASQACGSVQTKSSKFFEACVPKDLVAMIPMPPSTKSKDLSRQEAEMKSTDRSSVTSMPLKKRWRQSLAQEPKKKKVSLEAYRKRRASGGESGDSILSTSGTDSASTSAQLKEDVKKDYKLARQLGRQKMSLNDLEKRKAKLKRALKQIDSASGTLNVDANEAKNEFDKFVEKQSRWLEKRAREKQREVKLEKFTSSLELNFSTRPQNEASETNSVATQAKHSCSDCKDVQTKRTCPSVSSKPSHILSPPKSSEVSLPKRARSDFTSTLHCLQMAKAEVQRQLEQLKSPATSNVVKVTNGYKPSSGKSSPKKVNVNSPKHSSRK